MPRHHVEPWKVPDCEPFPALPPHPRVLTDAAGTCFWMCIFCDTDTGEVWHYKPGEDGRYETDPVTFRLKVTREFAALPLRFVPVDRPQPEDPA